MEYSIIHSDLENVEIKPQKLLDKYSSLLASDIKACFRKKELAAFGCPTSGKKESAGSFKKLGMTYAASPRYGNIYITPRPKQGQLLEFYQKSEARRFWLKELWGRTQDVRQQKIIKPQMEWVKTFVQEHLEKNELSVADYYPIQWACFEEVLKNGPKWNYSLIYPMFDPALCDIPQLAQALVPYPQKINDLFDIVFLFESVGRSENPAHTLKWALDHLKPGGLCFITCLLSSGFEVQVLGEASDVFMPPERMNVFSFEGLTALIEKTGGFQLLEFSTPGVLDVPNIIYAAEHKKFKIPPFMKYIIKTRKDPKLNEALQDFLQMNQLSSFGRLVLRRK